LFRIEVPFGHSEMFFELPRQPLILEPKQSPPVPDDNTELRQSLRSPIGTKRLQEIVSPSDKVAIVINDVTRPIPSYKIVPMLLEELRLAGVRRESVSVVVATGVHRACSRDELCSMLGEALLGKVNVENHDCKKTDSLVNLGKTRRGVPVTINRTVGEADRRILTGLVSPHHVAGYSGGRKSLMPGVAGLDALKVHHSEKFRPIGPAMGMLEGNQFHEEAEEAAEISRIDFIMNVVLNSRKQLVNAVAGDLKQAWCAAVSVSESMYRIDVADQVDIVVTSPGGYPKDIDLWQAQKAISSAEAIVRKGGTIILVAECKERFGQHTFSRFFERTTSPRDVIDEFNRRGYEPGLSKAFMYARALERAELVIVTKSMNDAELAKVYTRRADSVEKALEMATKKLTGGASIAVMPYATEVVPHLAT